MNILIIEDNAPIAANIGDYLTAIGHTVDFAYNGRQGLMAAGSRKFDALIVDVMLPGIDGTEICERLRQAGQSVPILMLTARDTLDDKISGFQSGADDYLVKPFAMEEVAARLESLYRRSTQMAWQRTLRVDDLEFDIESLEAMRNDRKLRLTPTLRQLLEHLMRNTHRTVTRRELEHLVWGDNPPNSDALRSHIHALRNEVDGPADTRLLKTVYGSGYRLCAHDER